MHTASLLFKGKSVTFELNEEECEAMRYRDFIALEIEEMRRHKWIQSEKAGRDLGSEALLDWAEHHDLAFHQHVVEDLGESIDAGDSAPPTK
jgi:hypothetical protein